VKGQAPDLRGAADEAVRQHLNSASIVGRAAQVVAYWALSDEVDLSPSLHLWVEEGKRVFLPIVGEDLSLAFVRWDPTARMIVGRGGAKHPGLSHDDGKLSEDLTTVSLVPGVAFDASGSRLGRGKGCYDRVLADLSQLGATIGVAYSCQLLDQVPTEDHDHRLDWLVDEQSLRRCSWGGSRR
jgi:5-formyltetrahydrofolate cyclo-ligase